MQYELTMGSLFDGIGGFPLAAIRHGITPVWASEIESFPMAVTKIRFPDMLHVGDITKLDGAKLPPVDIICGGSPCQDLSVAGKRAGLAGERSGLFMEQIRVIKEMRDADRLRGRTDAHIRPRFGVWENVPGAFSSGEPKGEDFRIVLEEFVRIVCDTISVPRPDSGRWEPAGRILLGNSFSLAWRCLDAQYWQVPQRRNRVFVVQILEARPHPKYYLTPKACQGILRRAVERGKPLPEQLRIALEIQAGVRKPEEKIQDVAFYINQRNEGIDLNGVSGALMATRNMQMQTFVTQQENGIAFAQNQRDEVRDLHDVAGALSAQPGVKQQTFVAAGVVTKGNGDCFLTEEKHTALSAGGGQAGQGYPCVLCLNDRGGQFMNCSENITGTLRAQMNAHQPLILEDTPKIYENHGIDSRYTGPHEVSPTLSARCGTGGNNVPLVDQREDVFCITGNAIDRQPQNGGNGLGINVDVSFSLTTADRHAIYARQRVDEFRENDVVSTESARQHKDATDLVMQPYQKTVGTLVRSDHKGIGNQYVNDDKCIVEGTNLIRRLTPLECERLQGFPDEWTNIPTASDSARYKALGNSVAIPCVEFIMGGIALILKAENKKRRRRVRRQWRTLQTA